MKEVKDSQYKSIENIGTNIKAQDEDLIPIIKTHNGLVEQKYYTGNLEPIVENYLPEGMNLTEQELMSLRNGMKSLSTGLRSSIPITCYGESCPFISQCVDEDALIFGPGGYSKKIKNVCVGDVIYTYNEKTREVEPNKVLEVKNNGKRETREVIQKNGCSVSVTSDHPILAIVDKVVSKREKTKLENLNRKWTTLEEGLSPGDKVASFSVANSFGEISAVDDAILLGYMLTDGSFSGSSPSFTNTNKKYIQEVLQISDTKGLNSRLKTRETWIGKDGVKHKESYEVKFLVRPEGFFSGKNTIERPFNEWAADKGLRDIMGPDKFIPGEVWLYDKESLGLFINRTWAGDGCIAISKEGKANASISQESLSFIEDLKALLLCRGIKSTITESSPAFWRLRISGNSLSDFFNLTGKIFGKEENSEKAILWEKNKNKKHDRREGEIDWNEIDKIGPLRKRIVYDLSLEGNENFFANGILVHNCPLAKINKLPTGKDCPIEAMLMDTYTKRYIDEFQVPYDLMSEVTTMTMLAATHIMEMRAFIILGKDDESGSPTGFIKNVVGFNNEDEPIIQLQEHPAYNQIERAWRWRKNLLESLVGTRKEKYKQMAAMNERTTASPSTAAADLKAKIDKMSVVDISEE